MTLIEPPASVNFGYVAGWFATTGADTDRDPDHLPDFEPAKGSVTFRPATTKVVTSSPNRYVGAMPVTHELNTAGFVGVWLILGTYTVTFKLSGLTIQTFDITVTAEHTEASPLDLVAWAPTPVEPNVVWVVNRQVYDETIAARDEVVGLLENLEGGLGAGIDDATVGADTTWSSTKITADLAGRVPTSRTVAGKPLSSNVTLVKGDVGLSNVDNTSDAAKPVSTATQTALNAKADTSSLSGYVPTARTVAGKPLTADVSLAKADVGLGSVDNTSDANKPVSSATQTALNAKADTTALAGYVPTARTVAGKALTSNVTLAKADVGLGNVDNTSDAAKPVSTATQTALNAKLTGSTVATAANLPPASSVPNAVYIVLAP